MFVQDIAFLARQRRHLPLASVAMDSSRLMSGGGTLVMSSTTVPSGSATTTSAQQLASAGLPTSASSMSNYRIISTIGRGNFGVCHLCECIDTRRSVACKLRSWRASVA